MALHELSYSEQLVYEALMEAAQDNLPCPLNLDIEMLTGFESSSMGPAIVRRLEAKGYIIVKRFQRFREVQIVATGQWTARSPSQRTAKAHVPRGTRSRQPAPTDRKPYKSGRL